jgi:hypothetical protein
VAVDHREAVGPPLEDQAQGLVDPVVGGDRRAAGQVALGGRPRGHDIARRLAHR